jgi:Ca2+-binding RTX toxin-like protein
MAVFRFELPQPTGITSLGSLAIDLFSFAPTQVSSTFLRERQDADNFLVLKGTGLVWQVGMPVTPVAGEFTELHYRVDGADRLTITGLKGIDAAVAWSALTSFGAAAFLGYLTKGHDQVFGTAQFDVLYGGAGNDRVLGRGEGDTLTGDSGRDSLLGGAGHDYFYGGDGRDVLFGGCGGDTIYGGDGGDRLFGGGADGPSPYNYLFGDDGNDVITGGTTVLDYMFGGDGNDTLLGARRFDTLEGGIGADSFQFASVATLSDNPFVADFGDGDDRILLDNDFFAALGAPGGLSAAAFRLGANATDASDRIFYDPTNGRLWYDRDGQGGAAKQLITIVFGESTTYGEVTRSDIQVIG